MMDDGYPMDVFQGYINDMTKELPEPWELDDQVLEKGEFDIWNIEDILPSPQEK